MPATPSAVPEPSSKLDSAPVVVVSTRACPYCKRAKQVLSDAGIPWANVDVSTEQELRSLIKDATGSSTVPQIFVNGASIGGSDDLSAAMADGSFQAAAAAAKPPALPPALLKMAKAAAKAADDAAAESAVAAEAGEQLSALASEMSSSSASTGGLVRLGGGTSGPFTGTAAVDWVAARDGVDRPAAVARMQTLLEANLVSIYKQGFQRPKPATQFADSQLSYVLVPELPLGPRAKDEPLNTRFWWYGKARPATEVSMELRGLILELYDKYLSGDGRSVSYKSIGKDPLFKRYVDATAELQSVDLAGLSVPELTALFINLYNALIVHALVVLGVPDGTLGRLSFFGAAKYYIAGSVYSADDMENGVLRGNKPAASSLWSLLGLPKLASGQFSKTPNDPRAKFVVPKVDPRIHFALVCGAKSCPPIKLYTPDNLDEGLQAAGEAFCASEVVVDKKANTVTGSKIFKWYAPDFGSNDAERLKYLSQFLKGSARADLDAMVTARDGGASIKFRHKEYDWSLNGE